MNYLNQLIKAITNDALRQSNSTAVNETKTEPNIVYWYETEPYFNSMQSSLDDYLNLPENTPYIESYDRYKQFEDDYLQLRFFLKNRILYEFEQEKLEEIIFAQETYKKMKELFSQVERAAVLATSNDIIFTFTYYFNGAEPIHIQASSQEEADSKFLDILVESGYLVRG